MNNRRDFSRKAQLSVADRLLLIGMHSALGKALVDEFMPNGPANYPRIDQEACLRKVEGYLRSGNWELGPDGKPRVKFDIEQAERDKRIFNSGPSFNESRG